MYKAGRTPYGEVNDFRGVKVICGCKDNHDQAECQDGFHAPCLGIGHICSELVCATANGSEGIWINLHRIAIKFIISLNIMLTFGMPSCAIPNHCEDMCATMHDGAKYMHPLVTFVQA